MRHPEWNDEENENYDRLSNPRDGANQSAVEGLAYTVVMEMYQRRKNEEYVSAEKQLIVDAIDQIADGICNLEKILGIDIHKMSERHNGLKLEELRKRKGGAE
jgi:RNA polymerase-interacting CarD/CdnL/TRCF family regulator